jgi:hypothetical protein
MTINDYGIILIFAFTKAILIAASVTLIEVYLLLP